MLEKYKPSKTGIRFHNDDKSYVRGIRGPVGSGKSTAAAVELFYRMVKQKPDDNNKRRTRFVVIRNTYRNLMDTVKPTLDEWLPKETYKFNQQNMTYSVQFKLKDNTIVESEILLRSMDKPQDIQKMLSLNITGAWLEEARELEWEIVAAVDQRCGRFPPTNEKHGPTWSGMIMTTNPSDDDHWWYRIFEEEQPEGWTQYVQPSGLAPDAENLQYLPPDYYKRLMAGKSDSYIDVYIRNNYRYLSSGLPVFPEYNDSIHFVDDELLPVNDEIIYMGIDFGLNTGIVFAYEFQEQFIVFDEWNEMNVGAIDLIEYLNNRLSTLPIKGHPVQMFGDPAGQARNNFNKTSMFDILNTNGFQVIPAVTNSIDVRVESVRNLLTRLNMNGQPRLVLGKRCHALRKAMNGGYQYKRMQVAGEARYKEMPDKNKYSHIADALQYAVLGAGYAINIPSNQRQPVDYSDYERMYG